jgi:hypothetical protein
MRHVVDFVRFGAAAIVAAGSLCAAHATAASLALSATFTPVGDAPNVEWVPSQASKFEGTIRAIDTHGVANFNVRFTEDPELSALGDLPATLAVAGFYNSYLGEPSPILRARLSFFYAGDTPFTVGGVDYAKGALLVAGGPGVDGYNFGLGPFSSFSLSSGIAGGNGGVIAFGVLNSADPPVVQYDPDFPGRPYILPGQGQWSGTFGIINVPEPTTWAMMLLGFAAGGTRLRRWRRLQAS